MKVEEGELKNSAGVGGAQEKEGEDLGGKSDQNPSGRPWSHIHESNIRLTEQVALIYFWGKGHEFEREQGDTWKELRK